MPRTPLKALRPQVTTRGTPHPQFQPLVKCIEFAFGYTMIRCVIRHAKSNRCPKEGVGVCVPLLRLPFSIEYRFPQLALYSLHITSIH